MTRDRVSYDALWNGRQFVVVDTGGWASDATGMAAQIAGQAEIAIDLADAVLFVVDATVGVMDEDEAVVRVLRRSQKPVVLAVNKVDDQRTEAEAATMWSLGLGEPYAVSALHGRGSGDMLDAILESLPTAPRETDAEVGGPRRVAIVGKPNVGKSSLLNTLAGRQRVVVDNAAGTTVDPVDELVEVDGTVYRFIDTAGIRRRVKEASGHEYYASLRTHGAIERAEVCVVVIDASEPVTEQDLRILTSVEEAGRALLIAFNKWDLTDEERRRYLNREIERDLVQFAWASRVNISAQDRPARRPARAGDRRGARQLGDADLHRQAERLPGPDRRRPSAPGPRRQAAADPVRHPGAGRSADVRPVHLRSDRARLPPLRRAPAARGVRLHRHADPPAGAGPGEARQALTQSSACRDEISTWRNRSGLGEQP